MQTPTVFIGSSTEQLAAARALKACLNSTVRATVWDEADFELGESVFGGLFKAADQFDFAVFIFNADDVARIRKTNIKAVRDNVVFELGLFTGRMGKGRAFWISSRGASAPHIPTDLAGIVHLSFQTPKQNDSRHLQTALEHCCRRLQTEFNKLGTRTDRSVDELSAMNALCVASSQYSKPKFEKDIKQIHAQFPKGSIVSAHGVSAQKLLEYFSNGRVWDIVHLAMYVDPLSGDLIIPNTDLKKRQTSDRLPIAGVESLIKMSHARLVTIVTCDSLLLGGRIGRITNTIAGYKPIDVQSALDWSAVFYRFLADGCALSEAFNRSVDFSDPGLVMIAKRDFRLSLQDGATGRKKGNGSLIETRTKKQASNWVRSPVNA